MIMKLLDVIMPGQEIVSSLFSDFLIWLILLLVANLLIAAVVVIAIILVRKKKASANAQSVKNE